MLVINFLKVCLTLSNIWFKIKSSRFQDSYENYINILLLLLYHIICKFLIKNNYYSFNYPKSHLFIYSEDRDVPSILPLLNQGFNKIFTETTNLNRCINELLTLEFGEVANVKRLQAAHVLFTALEYANDSIEILNSHFNLLVSNLQN